MKRLLSMLLGMTLLLSLAACGSTPQGGTSTQPPAPSPEPSLATEPSAPTDNESAKTLVVYFSATNRTEAVAQTIADTLGADLFEIVPTTPYTDADLNWRDEDSRVCQEHDDPARQMVELETVTPDNWADYDTVFIGYPIWWQNASWVVGSFVSANDFEGKTVYPFCTSASSSLGESDKNLATQANGGEWREGIRFSSNVSADTVMEWLGGLELS